MKDDFRYEIKYEINPQFAGSIRRVIAMHPQGFRKVFPDRWVNNIYFDTPGFVTCQDNLSGISERKKYRLRWYGDINPIERSTFEIKIKSNMVGRKENTRMAPDTPLRQLLDQLRDRHDLPDGLQPTIQNRYLRSYFLNFEGNFRLTVDRHLQHASFDKLLGQPSAHLLSYPLQILELKFEMDAWDQHKAITRFIPYRQTKHSKYVSAVMACWT